MIDNHGHHSLNLAVLVAALSIIGGAAAGNEGATQTLDLDNGLRVLVIEDHDLPLVALTVMVEHGSRDDAPGQHGYAHLAEHVMFSGTARVDATEYWDILLGGGAYANGGTTSDTTTYVTTGPAALLPTMLWVEADRFEHLGASVTPEQLAVIVDVVRNERRQRVEMTPYGTAMQVLYEQMYPEGHPHRIMTAGEHEHLAAATVEDVRALLASGYAPGNVTVAIAGDVDPETTFELVQSLFGGIPAGEPHPPVTIPAVELEAKARAVVQDRVPYPRLYFAWHSPAYLTADDALMDLTATILEERLNKELTRKQDVTRAVDVQQYSRAGGSLFVIMVEAEDGVGVVDLEGEVDQILQQYIDQPPNIDELREAQLTWAGTYQWRLEQLDDRAAAVARYDQMTGNPDFAEPWAQTYHRATLTEMCAIATAVLDRHWAVVTVLPVEEELAAAGAWTASPATGVQPAQEDHRLEASAVDVGRVEEGPEDTGDPAQARSDAEVAPVTSPLDNLPDPSAPPPVTPRAPEEFTLRNGLRVWYYPRATIPMVHASLVIDGGTAADPPDMPGTACLASSALLNRTYPLPPYRAARELGAQIKSSAHRDAIVLEARGFAQDTDKLMGILAAAVTPLRLSDETFDGMQQWRRSTQTSLAATPSRIVHSVGQRHCFEPGHPYSAPPCGLASADSDVSRDAVNQYLRRQVRPRRAILVIVGDVGDRPLQGRLEAIFRHWRKPGLGPEPEDRGPAVAATPASPELWLVDRPGSTQSYLALWYPSGPLTTRERVNHALLAQILTGSVRGRLDADLREGRGVTYNVDTSRLTHREASAFTLVSSVETPATGETVAALIQALDLLRADGVTAEELAYACTTVSGQLTRSYTTIDGVNGTLELRAELGLAADESLDTAWLDEVTPEDLTDHARTRLDPDRLVIVVVGDAEQLLPQLADHGLPAPMYCDGEGVPLD